LTKAGFQCTIESGAGVASGFYDTAYTNAGAVTSDDKAAMLQDADILLKVNAPLRKNYNS
jgi:NAD(P) transhydrogenase subunit alpha